MPNVMVALPNIGGALCSTPQSLADAHYLTAVQQRCQDAKPVEICRVPQTTGPMSAASGRKFTIFCCLASFFPIVDTCLSCENIARQNCAMVPIWRFLPTFLRPVFSASRVQQVSDLHLKFALRPHHVWKYGRHPICGGWDEARKEKRRKNKEQTTAWKYNGLPHSIGRP